MSLPAVQTDDEMTGPIMPDVHFVVPMARAALLQKSRDENGEPQLTLFHRGKEVTWDDPKHFAFADMLTRCPHFAGAEAARWGEIGWDAASEMLESLEDQGVIVRAAGYTAPTERHDHKPMPSPLPPAPMQAPRSWMDSRSLMAELTGTDLDLAWLETVVPIFRTGHLFVDRDGRQVGEANAFPASARLAVETDWRGCPYAGNRYQAEKPMNVTALRAMRQHWRQMMGLLIEVRKAYLARFPDAAGGWTVGHVERLSVAVLALPSYMALRCDRPVANGDLHPALSNLFRVTDGLRMVVHQMLFLPLHEKMRSPEAPVDAAELLAYADRNYAFHSDHGVCAGPRFMVEDFLGVILHGSEPRSGFADTLDPDLQDAVACIPQAMDYAMLGLETYAVVFSLWPAMARAYQALHDLLASGGHGPAARTMANRFAGHFEALSHRSFLASEEWRAHRVAVYDDMYAFAHGATHSGQPEFPLSAATNPAQVADPRRQSSVSLAAAAAAHFGETDKELANAFAGLVSEFLERGRLTLRLAEAAQLRTAALLHRPQPDRRLTLQDLNLHNVLMGEDNRSVPFLPDEIGRLLDLTITVTADDIAISPRSFSTASTHSAGLMPAE